MSRGALYHHFSTKLSLFDAVIVDTQDELAAQALAFLSERGLLDPAPSPTLARVLLAISNALGTLVAQSDEPAVTRSEVSAIWERLLRSLSTEPDAK